ATPIARSTTGRRACSSRRRVASTRGAPTAQATAPSTTSAPRSTTTSTPRVRSRRSTTPLRAARASPKPPPSSGCWSNPRLLGGDQVAIITDDSERGLFTIRHSTAHVLAQAVLDLFPGATFGIGPPVENGFYYDFELPGGATFVPEDLDRIDARMREIIKEK